MPASFEPTIDYIVTKIPRFAFEKFPGTERILGTSMKSVGEAMAMGRNFQESLQKALRSLETGLTGLNEIEITGDIREALVPTSPDRLLRIAQALRMGVTPKEICAITKFDPWFVDQLQQIVTAEDKVRKALPQDGQGLLALKKMGFSDARLAELSGKKTADITALRHKLDVRPVYKRVDTCAGEFEATTPYMYSAYESDGECESQPTARKKIVILGGGPNRIGQGIEFDYCCVHAAYALKDAGYETIMINCNPETVSTDYDTSDRLYFEPLTGEDVVEIIRAEQKNGELVGVIVQFGGQTPLKLAKALEAANIPIIGTSPDAIDLAEDRERFQQLLHKLKLKQPANSICHNEQQVIDQAERIGFPVVVRPSYVLGGRGMAIIHDAATLKKYITDLVAQFGDGPILLDSYLRDAIEVDVDALGDGKDVYVAGIMEHIEEAGIHSGDSACSLPAYSLSQSIQDEIRRQTIELAKALDVIGLMNVQFAVKDGEIFILEVNPRASRTVPFVAKATGIQLAKIASRIMAGEKLANFKLQPINIDHIAVKEAVFPFARFPGVDVILGPEMKSTGETMGIDRDFARAFAKAHLGAGGTLPQSGNVFISVRDSDKQTVLPVAKQLTELGFTLVATRGTASFFESQGLAVTPVNKVREGRPHIVDMLKDGEIAFIINTTEGAQSISDSFSIRRTALLNKIAYTTTISGSRAIVQAIAAVKEGKGLEVYSLQSYFTAQTSKTKQAVSA